MKTITIIEGVTLTATRSTINAFRAEVARAEARRQEAAEHAKLVAWLRDPANFAGPLYSDIYKDVHGVRPLAGEGGRPRRTERGTECPVYFC